MTIHPLWRDVVELISITDGSIIKTASNIISRHFYNELFPAQLFENVCLSFTSEVSLFFMPVFCDLPPLNTDGGFQGYSHYLSGGSPFWALQRGVTRLVILKGTSPIPGAQKWPPNSPLPQVTTVGIAIS